MSNENSGALDAATVRATITEIWNDVLDVRDGQGQATFFELRGQSITAVQIVARIEEELGLWVDVGDLFEDPDLGAFIDTVVANLPDSAGEGDPPAGTGEGELRWAV